jgi:general stress protein 26
MAEAKDVRRAMAESRSLMRRMDLVTISTLDDEGRPEARVVFNLLAHRAQAMGGGPAGLDPEGFSSYMGTNASSRKVAQLKRDGRCHLYFHDSATLQGLGLSGTMDEVADPAVRAAIYIDAWDRYYPGGRDGGDFCLMRFKPEKGRYYHGLNVVEFDARPGKAL